MHSARGGSPSITRITAFDVLVFATILMILLIIEDELKDKLIKIELINSIIIIIIGLIFSKINSYLNSNITVPKRIIFINYSDLLKNWLTRDRKVFGKVPKLYS